MSRDQVRLGVITEIHIVPPGTPDGFWHNPFRFDQAEELFGQAVQRCVEAEVDANLRRGEPLWRETGDGHGTTLIVTDAGLLAIGIEPVVACTMTNLRKAKLELLTRPKDAPEASPSPATPKPVSIRAGTKQAEIIALIQRPEGASIAEIVEGTGWLAHSARGLISGGLKKKLNLPIIAEKVTGRGTVYKLEAA